MAKCAQTINSGYLWSFRVGEFPKWESRSKFCSLPPPKISKYRYINQNKRRPPLELMQRFCTSCSYIWHRDEFFSLAGVCKSVRWLGLAHLAEQLSECKIVKWSYVKLQVAWYNGGTAFIKIWTEEVRLEIVAFFAPHSTKEAGQPASKRSLVGARAQGCGTHFSSGRVLFFLCFETFINDTLWSLCLGKLLKVCKRQWRA